MNITLHENIYPYTLANLMKDLETDRELWTIRVGPKFNRGVLIRGRLYAHREGNVKMEQKES